MTRSRPIAPQHPGSYRQHKAQDTRAKQERWSTEASDGPSGTEELNADISERFKRRGKNKQSEEHRQKPPAQPINQSVREYFDGQPLSPDAPRWLQLPEVPTTEELLGDEVLQIARQMIPDVEQGHDVETTSEWAEQWEDRADKVALTADKSRWESAPVSGYSESSRARPAELNNESLWETPTFKMPSQPGGWDEDPGWNETAKSGHSWKGDKLQDGPTSNAEFPIDSWSEHDLDSQHNKLQPKLLQERRRLEAQEDPEIAGFTDKTVNYVTGPWPSKDVYLRNHYKLLREDALRPIKESVRAFLLSPDMTENSKNAGIGIYEQARLCGITLSLRGLGFKMTFSTRRTGKKIRWEQSKRLLAGSLVVLVSTKSPRVCRLATVAARPLSGLNRSPPEIDLFFHHTKDVDFDCSLEWTILENRTGFYESSRHTMVALQRMMAEDFSMSKYLVDVQKQIDAPKYLTEQPIKNFRSLEHNDLDGPQSFVDILKSWPPQFSTLLDKSQQDAVRRILTKSISIVQGPPGTGKTFTSVASLRFLVANHVPGDPPIIVACQTNHALDQLLRHIADFDQGYARIGGQSQDPGIREHTVYSLRQKVPGLPVNRPAPEWTRLSKDISERVAMLSGKEEVIEPADLLKYGILHQQQVDSLDDESNAWSTAGESDTSTNSLKAWIGKQLTQAKTLAPDDFGFDEQEDSEDEFEELLEQEAEQITRDEEDELERLAGDFIPIKDIWTGKVVKSVKVDIMEKRLQKENDLNKIKINERGQYYRYFMTRMKDIITEELRPLCEQYNNVISRRKIRKFEIDEVVLRDRRIIGLTTTGLAKYRALIASLRPKILVIEEAAESLEAPVATGCVESIEHLILVGDHQQLRPHCHVSDLEGAPYNMNISLFERLIDNSMGFSRLALQRRMRPSISKLLAPIYADNVKDHPTVRNLADIPGMRASCFFFTHEFPESKDRNLSAYNIEEAEMVVGLVRHLVLNGNRPNKITIITFYQGQRRKLMLMLRRDPILGADIQVKTVDSYQGEENDIMILSLVRNNTENSVGFLSVENRVCVAISRARRGFYMFGNAQLLCGESKLWSDIVNIMEQPSEIRQVGYHLPTQCQRHERMTWLREPRDWTRYNGGCDKPCEGVLGCGHRCPMLCHPNDTHFPCKVKGCHGTSVEHGNNDMTLQQVTRMNASQNDIFEDHVLGVDKSGVSKRSPRGQANGSTRSNSKSKRALEEQASLLD